MPFWFLEDLKTTTTVKVWPFLADFSYNEQEKFSSNYQLSDAKKPAKRKWSRKTILFFLTSLKIISQLFRFHVLLATHPSRNHPAKHVKINHIYFWVLPIKYLICLWFSLFIIMQKQQDFFFADKAMSCSFYAKRNHMGLKRNLNCNYVC